MTPEEILRDLRDIRMPEAAGAELPADYAVEPFLILALLIVGIAMIRRLRGRHWRWQARARLAVIEREDDAGRRWQHLLDLLRDLSPLVGHPAPPDAGFLPRDQIGAAEVDALQAHIRSMIAR